MKAQLQPLIFSEANERERNEFEEQLTRLRKLYGDEAEFLPARVLGDRNIPEETDAMLFPQLVGAVFAHAQDMSAITKPIIVMTSEFGTVEMWDWEIVAYLRETFGLQVFTPYSVELGRVILRALATRKSMTGGVKFLMFQDDPGEGMQAYIFKRFYWWETQCKEQIERAFGVQIVYASWKEVNEQAKQISDEQALTLWITREVEAEGVPMAGVLKAVKLYIAVKQKIDEIGGVGGVGANCLNESFHSDTTPCLAWDWIFEYDHIMWACEGDIVSLISQFIIYSALQAPLMMTNLYPFLTGMAALKHEKIEEFPNVENSDNHALGVHCGYFGFAPRSFCTDWTMRPRVLEIVDSGAIVIDCRMRTGPITMAKLHADMKKLTIIEAEMEEYAQYPGSDCRNGALIRYRNNCGHQVMESLSSHHAILIEGEVTPQLLQMAKIFGFETEVI